MVHRVPPALLLAAAQARSTALPVSGYRPGIRGWWQFLRLPELIGEVRADGFQRGSRTIPIVLGMLGRRLRPSARLRQSEQERDHWKRRAMLLEGLEWTPAAARSERRRLRRALLSLPTARRSREDRQS